LYDNVVKLGFPYMRNSEIFTFSENLLENTFLYSLNWRLLSN